MLITRGIINDLSKAALSNERLRKNICLHKSQDAPAQIMINNIEVGSKMDIHRHHDTDETLVILRGRMEIVYYSDKGEKQESFLIGKDMENIGIVIPKEQYHNILLTEPVTVLEVKDGPYRPLQKDEVL